MIYGTVLAHARWCIGGSTFALLYSSTFLWKSTGLKTRHYIGILFGADGEDLFALDFDFDA